MFMLFGCMGINVSLSIVIGVLFVLCGSIQLLAYKVPSLSLENSFVDVVPVRQPLKPKMSA